MSGSEQLTSSQTSSIGAVWPPTVTTHNRLRGFFTEEIVTQATAPGFAEQVAEQQGRLEALEATDRLTIRAVVHAGALATLEDAGLNVEAAIPLANTGHDDLVIAYTGYNEPARGEAIRQLAAHHELLVCADELQPDGKDPMATLQLYGFTHHTVDRADAERLAPRFHQLYSAFGYTEQDVIELLGSANNTIAYAQHGEHIISTAMAESGSIVVEGLDPLHIIEITEASTHPDYRKRGLYEAISGLLVRQLLEGQGETINALYGESNLAMPGVVFAAAKNGRRFSHFDRISYGLIDPGFGILPQNFHVDDGAERRQYNDFAVSYVPLS